MNQSDILRLRLASQRIVSKAAPLDPAGVARHFLAMQAQDFGQALWAIGVRSPGSSRASVIDALESGALVRSSPLRGTLMWVPGIELKWMTAVTGERSIRGAATRLRQLELDDETLASGRRIAERALPGNPMTREEFFAELTAAGIDPKGQRGYHVIWWLAQLGVACWGPPKGTQQALVLLDEWVPNPRTLDRDEGLRELALRYFTAHGPATLRDFAWWAQLTLKDAKAGLDACSDELEQVDDLWMSAEEVANAPATMTSAIIALPGFDEYVLGYTDRTHPLAEGHFQRIVPGNNGIFLPMIVSKGRVVGTWRRPKNVFTPEFFEGDIDVAKAGKAYETFSSESPAPAG